MSNPTTPPEYHTVENDATVIPAAAYENKEFVPDKVNEMGIPCNKEEVSETPDELLTIAKPPTAPMFELEPHERPLVVQPPALTEEEIREACLDFAAEHCCYGSKFVKQMVIPQILNGAVLHYRLESLTERRETAQKFNAYCGQTIDGPENGAAPDPWEMNIIRPNEFKSNQARFEIPHTAFVRQCNRCSGTGKIICSSCNGFGRRSCTSCGGTGRSNNRSCSSCGGSGRQSCWRCGGSGRVQCPRCTGYGRLKWFTMLIVTWTNHAEDFITDSADLPKERILRGQGMHLFNEEDFRVLPVCNAPDATVNIASTQMVEKHGRGFVNEMTLKQRQWLRAVPFTTVRYGWKSKTGEFYIYGTEKHVYFEEYPQPCCCCTCL